MIFCLVRIKQLPAPVRTHRRQFNYCQKLHYYNTSKVKTKQNLSKTLKLFLGQTENGEYGDLSDFDEKRLYR
jgi:hypothetical protein